MSHSILLVEDDARLSSLVAGYLRKHGYEVRTVLHGNEAVPAIVEYRPDLVVLDINLPGKDGFTILREARERFDGVIITVTARDDRFDEVLGLEFGADKRLMSYAMRNLLRNAGKYAHSADASLAAYAVSAGGSTSAASVRPRTTSIARR